MITFVWGKVWTECRKKGCAGLKRLLWVLLCIFMLCPQVNATTSEKMVALTFDDGPSDRFTRRLLQGLDQRQAAATFLLCGYRMAQYPELTRQIHQQGHEIGLHGYTHQLMNRMSFQEIYNELADTAALLPAGCTVQFLRPPGGKCNHATRLAAQQMELSLILWSVDPRDWNTQDTEAIVRQVVTQTRDGDVILLHDMSDSSVDAALQIVDALQAKGFRFVTLSQLAQARKIPLQPGKCYCRFG